MTDKELIKQEIERRIKNLKFSLENNCVEKYSRLDILGNITTLESLLQFIDSLPEEPASEDLEEAANFYANTHMEWFDSEGNPCVMPAFKAGAEWQEKKMLGIAEAFYQQGRYEQKQEMLKDAVELHIVESFNPVGTENEKLHGFTALYYNAKYPDFYPVTGQTIKVIPIKENNNE